jgi:hypothetical protein
MVSQHACAYSSGAYGFVRVPFTALGTFEKIRQWWKAHVGFRGLTHLTKDLST